MFLRSFLRSRRFPKEVPTLVHVTHAKAGSTWLDQIWRQLFGPHVAPRGKFVAAQVNEDLAQHVFAPKRIYSSMFMTHDEFMAHPELHDAKRFAVIRDLRDTLMSLYFSLKLSHPINKFVAEQRPLLMNMPQEAALLHLIGRYLRKIVRIQRSWLAAGEIVLRYEDILKNDEHLLESLLIERFQMPVASARLREVVRANRFEQVFKRPLGLEDAASHGRQGMPGNWRKHFTPAVAAAFRETFGDVLIATGYEADDSWAGALC